MKSFCASIAVISFILVSVVATAAQQESAPSVSAPTLVRIDGQLKTPTGEPRTGSVSLAVSLYEQKDDTTPLWVEQQTVTLDSNGRYTVFAGATLPDGVPQEFFSGSTTGRWLGVGVQGEAEQFRMMLVTVPYAAKAREAETLAGKAATDFVLTEHFSDSVQAALKTRAATSLGTDPGVALVDNYLQKTTGGGASTADSIMFDNGSSVGIGTTGPGGKLDVRGSLTLFGATQGYTFINNDELDFGYSANANYEGNINYSGYILGGTQFRDLGIFNGKGARIAFFQGSTSRLGIGTTAPVLPLTVVGANPSGALGAYTSNTGRGIAINPSVTAGTVDIYADYLGGSEPKLHLSTYANRGGAGGMTIDTAGSVGIGTSSPTQKLDVAGNINVSGNINAKYQDVAEWVETSAPIEAGTVVIVDPLNANRVLTAPGAYDTRVAGAVSRQPGLILGERSDSKAMVAQSGRVRIKADAKYGAIKIGDLLVTSPTPGYAMRSRPMKVGGQTMHRPGTLLGKALEALPNGQGEILVLLTLQ